MPRLTEAQENNAIGHLEAVAQRLNVSQSTIGRLWHGYQQCGTTLDCPGSGRQHVTTEAQDRFICLRHLHDRFTTATSTTSAVPGMCRISDQTVINHLREAGIRARSVRGVILTLQHRQ
ncbi:UNVERIFIED_CONTAM: hypothetical protein FKN15_004873 [Acipenser sinensis]